MHNQHNNSSSNNEEVVEKSSSGKENEEVVDEPEQSPTDSTSKDFSYSSHENSNSIFERKITNQDAVIASLSEFGFPLEELKQWCEEALMEEQVIGNNTFAQYM